MPRPSINVIGTLALLLATLALPASASAQWVYGDDWQDEAPDGNADGNPGDGTSENSEFNSGSSQGTPLTEGPPGGPAEGPPEGMPDFPFTNLTFDAGYFHMFRADINGGGSFSKDRFNLNFGGNTIINRMSRIRYVIGYSFDGYNFDGPTALGANPWNNINTFTGAVVWTQRVGRRWSIFGGPFGESSFENGADFGQSLYGGGMVGATYSFSREFTVGLGIGATTQLEESLRFFPVIVFDWKINDNWKVGNAPNYTGFSQQSFEIAYDFGAPDSWLAAFGVGYEFNRFRLDDSGAVPGGVGQDEALNLWLRLVYRPTKRFAVTGIVGVALAGRVRIENNFGSVISEQEYENGPFIGIAGRIAF